MTPPGNRQRRGGELIKDVLAQSLIRDLSDPRLGFVTITEVAASPDFAAATVYFTTLTRAQREPSLRALESARGLLQSRVGRAMRTRNTPLLDFVYDTQQDHASRIARLIDAAAPQMAPADESAQDGAE
jgi:ribosome-binding factor A